MKKSEKIKLPKKPSFGTHAKGFLKVATGVGSGVFGLMTFGDIVGIADNSWTFEEVQVDLMVKGAAAAILGGVCIALEVSDSCEINDLRRKNLALNDTVYNLCVENNELSKGNLPSESSEAAG